MTISGDSQEILDALDRRMESVPLDLALDRVAAFIDGYVTFTNPHQIVAIALWVAHTHAFVHAETTPYLHVYAPEKRSGKTRLLEVLVRLAHRPIMAADISPAAMFRHIEKEHPTLLLDEADAIFSKNAPAEKGEALRQILNAGYVASGIVIRTEGGDYRPREFNVFCPKAIAGIGDIPDTIADRSIRIKLHRQGRTRSARRFRRREAKREADPIRQAIETAVNGPEVSVALDGADPDLPPEIDDRAQDIWEPLLAIAEAAGATWAAKARTAAISLSGGEARLETESHGVRLLTDCRTVFDGGDHEKMFSSDLIIGLNRLEESPWESGTAKASPHVRWRTSSRTMTCDPYKFASVKTPGKGMTGRTSRQHGIGTPLHMTHQTKHPKQVNDPKASIGSRNEAPVEDTKHVPFR
jgi:hypothetical protein